MTRTVLVAGLSGRVGQAAAPSLNAMGLELDPLDRAQTEEMARHQDLVVPSGKRVAGVINLAGIAHVVGTSVDEVELWRANVELPLLLQRLAHALGCPFVHISSTKAARTARRDRTEYGESKRAAEILLESAQKASPDAPPTRVIRSCAVLAPPFEAGRLALLRKLSGRRWLGPDIRLPVVDPTTLAKIIVNALESAEARPFSIIEVDVGDRLRAREVVARLHAG